MSGIDRKAFDFFRGRAGWCVGFKAQGAANMARAEAAYLRAEADGTARYVVESDDVQEDFDEDYRAERLRKAENYARWAERHGTRADEIRAAEAVRNAREVPELYYARVEVRDAEDADCGHYDTDQCTRRCGWTVSAGCGGIDDVCMRSYGRVMRAELAIEAGIGERDPRAYMLAL